MSDGPATPRTITGPPYDRGDPEAPPKPCAKRIGSGKTQRWCLLPDDHLDPTSENYTPDCHGVVPNEIPMTDNGPNWRPNWSKPR